MQPIADYVTVSTPLANGPALYGAVLDVALLLDDARTDHQSVRVGKHGLVRYQERSASGVAVVSTSGHVLAMMRASNLLFEFCGAIASAAPYHVTHLDVAKDEECDAPARLQWLYGNLRIAGCALTRKRIKPQDVRLMASRGDDGRDTGSIMIGDRRRAETTAIIYDRRHDAVCKGKPDPGPLLRTEIRTGIPGLSLRDVYDPEPLFYHFAAPELATKPDHVPEWQPWGEMFDIDRVAKDAAEQLARLVDRSGDLDRMLALADQVPGDGLGLLQRLLAGRISLHRHTVDFEAARNVPCDSGQLRKQ